MVLNGKPLLEDPVRADVPQGSILGPTLLLLYTSDLSDQVNCNATIYTDNIYVYSLCNHASDLWQQLELVSELKSDLQGTRAGSGFLISIPEKLSLFEMTSLVTQVLLMQKLMGLYFRKNHLLKYWDCLSPQNWIGPLTLSLLLKVLQENWSLVLLYEVYFF